MTMCLPLTQRRRPTRSRPTRKVTVPVASVAFGARPTLPSRRVKLTVGQEHFCQHRLQAGAESEQDFIDTSFQDRLQAGSARGGFAREQHAKTEGRMKQELPNRLGVQCGGNRARGSPPPHQVICARSQLK